MDQALLIRIRMVLTERLREEESTGLRRGAGRVCRGRATKETPRASRPGTALLPSEELAVTALPQTRPGRTSRSTEVRRSIGQPVWVRVAPTDRPGTSDRPSTGALALRPRAFPPARPQTGPAVLRSWGEHPASSRPSTSPRIPELALSHQGLDGGWFLQDHEEILAPFKPVASPKAWPSAELASGALPALGTPGAPSSPHGSCGSSSSGTGKVRREVLHSSLLAPRGSLSSPAALTSPIGAVCGQAVQVVAVSSPGKSPAASESTTSSLLEAAGSFDSSSSSPSSSWFRSVARWPRVPGDCPTGSTSYAADFEFADRYMKLLQEGV